MKKIIFLVLMVFVLGACSDNISDLNIDTKKPEVVPASSLIGHATLNLFDLMTETNVNWNNFRLWAQQWSQTTYADESNYELVERNVNGRMWNTMYATVLRDIKDAKKFIEADVVLTQQVKDNQYAILAIMETYVYSVLVDVFGDVPFTEALAEGIITPAYDNDTDIYSTIISNLNKAIDDLGGATGMEADLIYGGDAEQWKKFGNSLKLKLAIRIADLDNAKAKSMAEAAVASGVFTSSDDDFQLAYESSPPYTNPLWDQLVQSGRSDFIAANTLGDYMNDLNDPRRAYYFKDLDVDGNVIGGVYGDNGSFPTSSKPGYIQEDPTHPGTIMSYSEVEFLLADAVERGYSVGGTAADHYNAGVTNSIMEWGGSADDAAAYLAQADVAYATAPGTWKEKIALQKWIALYDMGFEAWCTYKVYDAPVLNIAAVAQVPTPKRYTYPVTEFSLNGDNVKAAGVAIGGDLKTTPVFWDVN
ncbi:MAG: SusD/RagB family nutrient-binding outer membrane lipoprotein [Saprospiraceae bacterium]|nr:SusD/RagB family nutrient-binding outer membrane lipoprotein [Saprospiraceae bacterium]MCB9326999.1 SusD/RagB family nutrient-binding outer membrane lipoprotein [Lewinellaceae bacterium]